MEVINKSHLFNVLEHIGRETNDSLPYINEGGCGVYASLVGSATNYDLFTPVARVGKSGETYVKGNTLISPPPHIQLLFEDDDCEYLYDSNGFEDITGSKIVAKNSYEYYSRVHSFIKVSWESLLKVTQDTSKWHYHFDREEGSSILRDILYNVLSNERDHDMAPDVVAIQDFMSAFRC